MFFPDVVIMYTFGGCAHNVYKLVVLLPAKALLFIVKLQLGPDFWTLVRPLHDASSISPSDAFTRASFIIY